MKARAVRTGVFAGLGAVALVAGFAVSTQSAQADAVPLTAAEQHAMTLRADSGFEHDLPYVRKLEHTPGLDENWLGIPLTAQEAGQMAAREGTAPVVAAVSTELRSRADFGGAWIVQEGNGGVAVALTAPPSDAVRAEVARLVPHRHFTRFVVVKRDLASLEDLAARISADPARDASGDPYWTTAGVREMSNVVEVRVVDRKHADWIRAHYADGGLSVVVAPAPVPQSARVVAPGADGGR